MQASVHDVRYFSALLRGVNFLNVRIELVYSSNVFNSLLNPLSREPQSSSQKAESLSLSKNRGLY